MHHASGAALAGWITWKTPRIRRFNAQVHDEI
jgi:hypothetical protein